MTHYFVTNGFRAENLNSIGLKQLDISHRHHRHEIVERLVTFSIQRALSPLKTYRTTSNRVSPFSQVPSTPLLNRPVELGSLTPTKDTKDTY